MRVKHLNISTAGRTAKELYNKNKEFNMHDMQTCGLDLFNKGFNIVPVEPNDKRVILKDWPTFERSITQVQEWILKYPNHGVGAISKDTPFIDIDITDVKIGNKVYTKLLELLPDLAFSTRTGQYPKMAIPCQLPPGFEPFSKVKTSI